MDPPPPGSDPELIKLNALCDFGNFIEKQGIHSLLIVRASFVLTLVSKNAP